MDFAALYVGINKIAEDIDNNLGFGAAMALHSDGKIDDAELKKILDFEELSALGYPLSGLQKNARAQINKRVLHSFTAWELFNDFHVHDLEGRTIARNGWRWQPDKALTEAQPKVKPRLPGGFAPRVDNVPGYYEDRDVDAVILAAVNARQSKATPPDRMSVYAAILPVKITVPQRNAGRIAYHGEMAGEVAVAVVLDPESGIAMVLPQSKCPPAWQRHFPSDAEAA